MKTHIDYILEYYPGLLKSRVLDVGSGRGRFLIDMAFRGGHATGLEVNPEYITLSRKNANDRGFSVDVIQGVAEKMSFPDDSFDFLNVSEVFEHVDNPNLLLSEMKRVLVAGGQAYLSVPNRFGWKDPHFHLYVVNWLPRFLANPFISFLGKHKNYTEHNTGIQNITLMHYATFGLVRSMLSCAGFFVEDIRERKLRKKFKHTFFLPIIILTYRALRFAYFDTFHLLLTKRNKMRVMVSADDYGVTRNITDTILDVVDNGAISSVSIVANGNDFQHAIEEIKKRPEIYISVHVNLTEGKPLVGVGESILVGRSGRFKHSFQSLWFHYVFSSNNTKKRIKQDVEIELRAQIRAITEALPRGFPIGINGHEHVHMIPFVFGALINLIKEFGIQYVRIPVEPFIFDSSKLSCYFNLNIVKHFLLNALSRYARRQINGSGIEVPDVFIGVLFTGGMSLSVVRSALETSKFYQKSPKMVEILFHPGEASSKEKDQWHQNGRFRKWYLSSKRLEERSELLSREFKKYLEYLRA